MKLNIKLMDIDEEMKVLSLKESVKKLELILFPNIDSQSLPTEQGK